MRSWESARTSTRVASNSAATSSARMSAVYSATLLVATPMVSLTDASVWGGSLVASSTTAPIPAGPGFPRDPPSQKRRIVRRTGPNPGNGSSLTTRCSRARDEDRAAVVAMGDVGIGAGLADPGDLRRRDREAAALTAVAHEPGDAHTAGRSTAPVVEREEIGGNPGGHRGARVGLRRDLGVDHRLLLLHRRSGGARLGLGRAHLVDEHPQLGVDRFLPLHQLQLTVLEGALVPAQLLDLALHRLELTRRGDRPGVHRGLDLRDLRLGRRGFVLQPLHVAADDVVPAAYLADRRLQV